MDKHSAQSLGKYLGKRVWYMSSHPVWGGLGELGIRNNTFDIWVDGYEDICPYHVSGTDTENIYPILKTVKDLTEEEIRLLEAENEGLLQDSSPYFLFYQDGEEDSMDRVEPCYLRTGPKLMEISTGAVPSNTSPTGYLSVHDGIPCKCWADVFGGINDN